MKKNTLGELFETSRLTLGGGGIGQVWGATSRSEAIATVQDAYNAGITLFDMAPLYGNGEAELVMGEAFNGNYPSDVRLTTKCMLGNAPPQNIQSILTSSLDQSMQRMRCRHIDVYILHGYIVPDGWLTPKRSVALSNVAIEWSIYNDYVIPTFETLKREGRIGAWGITAASIQTANMQAINNERRPDVVQCISNLLDSPGNMAITREPANPRAIIRQANKHSVGVMGIRAVAAGSLTKKIDREVAHESADHKDFIRAQTFRNLAAELATDPAVLAHQYALAMAGVDTVVLGVKNRDELQQCLNAESSPTLSQSVIKRVDDSVET